MLSAYLGLFTAAFVAATLVPTASEVGVVALSLQNGADLWLIWAVATAGNTLGAFINWLLGRFCYHWRDRHWFPFRPAQLERAADRFQHYGVWSLLFAWLPIVGDPLTFVAGLLRTPPVIFLALTGIGKGARYAVLIWFAKGLWPG